jgi:hypothetical protein
MTINMVVVQVWLLMCEPLANAIDELQANKQV